MTQFYHSGGNGDIIYSLPTVKALASDAHLILGTSFKAYLALKPLLLRQPYISAVRHVSQVDLHIGWTNLDMFRHTPVPWETHIVNKHLGAFDLPMYRWEAGGWLDVTAHMDKRTYAVVNRTPRYNDRCFNWTSELKWLDNNVAEVLFLGLAEEYDIFCKKYRYAKHLRYVPTDDYLAAASLIKGAKYFSGNQSSLMAVRQALGLPYRIEEMPYCADVRQRSANEYVINRWTRKLHTFGAAIRKILND